MASTLFQPYVDKENTGTRPKQRDGVKQGLGGKVFQSSGPNLTTPRRSALRDMNQDPSSQSASRSNKGVKAQKPLAPVEQLFKKPVLKPIEGQKKAAKVEKGHLVTSRSDSKHQAITKKPDPLPEIDGELPEIENLHIYDAEKEEVQPERDPMFVGVLEALRKWRPPCLFGFPSSSDSEDEELEQVPSQLLPDPVSLDDEELLNLSDVVMPFIDDIELPFDIEDLPIPYLDDSIDIEPNLGTLEVWDTSTPYKLVDGIVDSPEPSRDGHGIPASPGSTLSDVPNTSL